MAVFAKIVETGGISAAAGQLGIAKSAVSRRLNELETRLGVQLLNRTTRSSTLTEAGRLYYGRTQSILSQVDDLNDALCFDVGELKGTLKVAVPLSFGLLHLAPAVNEFAACHPDLVIDLSFADRQIDLIEEGVDLAIRIAELSDSTLIARRLTTIRHVLCASPAYLAANGVPETPADLASHTLLRYKSPTGRVHHLTDAEGRPHEIAGRTGMRANNGDFLKEACIAGHGIYLMPSFIAWRALQDGRLVRLLPDYGCTELGAYAVYPHTRFLTQRVRVFIDYLSAFLGDTPYWDE